MLLTYQVVNAQKIWIFRKNSRLGVISQNVDGKWKVFMMFVDFTYCEYGFTCVADAYRSVENKFKEYLQALELTPWENIP